jgi:hypothetical protein
MVDLLFSIFFHLHAAKTRERTAKNRQIYVVVHSTQNSITPVETGFGHGGSPLSQTESAATERDYFQSAECGERHQKAYHCYSSSSIELVRNERRA